MATLNQRSIKERIFHALLFEGLAILLTILIGVYILNKPVASMGILSVLISLTALLLNIVFNAIFDRYFPFVDGQRPVKIRILQAMGFEGSLILFTIPMIAFFLQVSLWEAFMIELGFLIFFLFYTYSYNWCYDQLRRYLIQSR
ncbi:PACE efflux transporter [Ignatzschineria larvae DSM 13226]|uniref:PACE efflux transporter n=1 Tax=Ignatzschineria larvae DSM 13226 TaxID=1111732 RepID=A0ABZ3C3M6_9GAMM|nr:PACE efflux transporter [Ignatzschineria larvae]